VEKTLTVQRGTLPERLQGVKTFLSYFLRAEYDAMCRLTPSLTVRLSNGQRCDGDYLAHDQIVVSAAGARRDRSIGWLVQLAREVC
jgi:hypothetical protein